jgi:hypothetical protein
MNCRLIRWVLVVMLAIIDVVVIITRYNCYRTRHVWIKKMKFYLDSSSEYELSQESNLSNLTSPFRLDLVAVYIIIYLKIQDGKVMGSF